MCREPTIPYRPAQRDALQVRDSPFLFLPIRKRLLPRQEARAAAAVNQKNYSNECEDAETPQRNLQPERPSRNAETRRRQLPWLDIAASAHDRSWHDPGALGCASEFRLSRGCGVEDAMRSPRVSLCITRFGVSRAGFAALQLGPLTLCARIRRATRQL